MTAAQAYDVAIIGGGPAGSTAGTLLKRYNPDLEVVILERERFPREHVGESQLPAISKILAEMGCWEQVEAAGFPIKIGATYRWGASPKLWDFDFVPSESFEDAPRPAKYAGQRLTTAFQVERALYDQILLRHAESLGCEVREETKVAVVEREGDRVEGLTLADGTRIEASHYLDGSGNAAILRRAMGVGTTVPTKLKNVAFWDYWENAEWAVSIGVGGTRVLVLSIGTGWIWFIPLGPTRTSIGYICPAEHAKSCGMAPAELYDWALAQEPLIQELTAKASRDGEVRATKDWSFVADRLVGENWMLMGEAAGFADPILAAGLTLTHSSAREAAYIVLDMERGEHDPAWLKADYEETQKTRVGQHIRFADYWYSANGQFTDLQDYTAEIARDAGLNLSPQQAFLWLGTGGFTRDIAGQAGLGGPDLNAAQHITNYLADSESTWQINNYNVLHLNLEGATETFAPSFVKGRIHKHRCYLRDGKRLPDVGMYALIMRLLERTSDATEMVQGLVAYFKKTDLGIGLKLAMHYPMNALEAMLLEGWIVGSFDENRPRLTLSTPKEGALVHKNRDLAGRGKDLQEAG